MDNYKDKRSGGNYSRDGKRERSYGDFNGEYRKRTRQQRFGKEGDRPQYVKVDRREDGDSRERGNARRYGSDVARYGSDRPRTRYNGDRRQGGYKAEGYERGEGSANNGNYGKGYSTQHRSGYQQRSRTTSAYDPNAKYSKKKRMAYREAAIDPNAPVRLNKYLANAGICSRREADSYISAGLISVNGVVVTELGTKVSNADDIRFNGERVTCFLFFIFYSCVGALVLTGNTRY